MAIGHRQIRTIRREQAGGGEHAPAALGDLEVAGLAAESWRQFCELRRLVAALAILVATCRVARVADEHGQCAAPKA
jgi:hypothetical protein